jgi:exonuclease SbcD
MNILHTSDWHLGRMLYGRKRYQEFAAFLDWLLELVEQQSVDVLIVAGDIFDTTTPSNKAQSLYYRFLARLSHSCCRHVVVVGGNHDSPSFLEAPKALLQFLDIHIIGAAQEQPEDEVLLLRDAQDQLELIVCAIPYLRDRDIRQAAAGESLSEKDQKMIAGIRAHYQRTFDIAQNYQQAHHTQVPIIATGHLFTSGGQTVEGDGVRELYVGSLAQAPASIFPAELDYVALGHLHVPQKVQGQEHIRYSGSPIAMGFGEAKQQKSVCLVRFQSEGNEPVTDQANDNKHGNTLDLFAAPPASNRHIELLPVPRFQALRQLRGDWAQISKQLTQIANELTETSPGNMPKDDVYLEIIYDGHEHIANLKERIQATISECIDPDRMPVLRIKNQQLLQQTLTRQHHDERLEQLNEQQVFERCLAQYQMSPEESQSLRESYVEIVRQVHEQDHQAE